MLECLEPVVFQGVYVFLLLRRPDHLSSLFAYRCGNFAKYRLRFGFGLEADVRDFQCRAYEPPRRALRIRPASLARPAADIS